jgi:TPP-dependent pyruvate/acetoin dehydrogenase alpha subunit
MITKEDLTSFTKEIKECFNNKMIATPIHLNGGNEEPLIEIFKNIRPQDWVFCSHRNSYHFYLKTKNRELTKNEILAGHSMHLCSKEHRVFSSAIVGGCCSIALGVALSIKLKGLDERVYCFTGDMSARTGIFYESVRYAEGFDLPVLFVVEDNKYSVLTLTSEVWGMQNKGNKIKYYSYDRINGHSGTGKFLIF